MTITNADTPHNLKELLDQKSADHAPPAYCQINDINR